MVLDDPPMQKSRKEIPLRGMEVIVYIICGGRKTLRTVNATSRRCSTPQPFHSRRESGFKSLNL